MNNEEEPPKKMWVDVIRGNKIPYNGISIEFIAPQIVEGEIEVAIEDEDVVPQVKFQETSLIMYAIGEYLSMKVVKQFMIQTWNFVKFFDMYFHKDGYFLLKFQSLKEKDIILTKGAYVTPFLTPMEY